ncbi:hypothetical protein K490DRAFT_45117 [Saccharata proteae CBS 121410]|uniref:DUF7918 domain-containing protein n=1 Tax=Saccharata proteae CBS 121410 TaxID=1314787 RepID=A0A9P4LW70_9PEZI|nr:hypothetical protein K490DRAFT_45117 [Saccharata proteae CBS 121410]
MAIHPDVPGVHVEIIVDGKALKEYDDPDTEETSDSTTKYVEAESGKAFSILLKIKSDYQHSKYDLTRTVSVDGIRVGSSVYFKKEFNGSFEGAWHRMRSFRNGKHIEQQMLFSDLSVDDGEVHNISKDQMNNISMLGTVKVGLFRAICKGSGGVLTQSADFKETDKVSEKALKGRAVSHSYRSKEALNSLHIIPRDPTPLPLEERPIEDLNPEEMRELLRRQKVRSSAAFSQSILDEFLAQ